MKLILIRFPRPSEKRMDDANLWCQNVAKLLNETHKVTWIFEDINKVEFEVIEL